MCQVGAGIPNAPHLFCFLRSLYVMHDVSTCISTMHTHKLLRIEFQVLQWARVEIRGLCLPPDVCCHPNLSPCLKVLHPRGAQVLGLCVAN